MRPFAPAALFLTAFALLGAPAQAQRRGDVIITELLANPGGTISDANGEWFELYNRTLQDIDLKNWFVQDSSAAGLRPPHKIAVSLVIPAGGFVVLGNTTNTTNNGGVAVDYAYGAAMAFANSLDGLRLLAPSPNGVDWTISANPPPDSVIIDRVRYGSAAISAQNGISRELRNDSLDNQDMDSGNWADAPVTSVYGPGGRGTPRAAGQTSLPVELVGFTAQSDGDAARLAWTTASETNNAGFAVEQQTAAGWVERGFAPGAGTTTERHDYGYAVPGLAPGRHTFRLRQVDFDGAAQYSPVAAVEIGVAGGRRMTFLGARAVRLEVGDAQAVTVAVYDLLGRRLSALETAVNGAADVALPALAPGAYVVRVTGERFVLSKVLVAR